MPVSISLLSGAGAIARLAWLPESRSTRDVVVKSSQKMLCKPGSGLSGGRCFRAAGDAGLVAGAQLHEAFTFGFGCLLVLIRGLRKFLGGVQPLDVFSFFANVWRGSDAADVCGRCRCLQWGLGFRVRI